MNDETIMAEKIGSLQQEKEQLEWKIVKQSREIHLLKNSDKASTAFWSFFAIIIALGIVYGAGYLCYKGLNDKITNHCYIKKGTSSVNVYRVVRIVDWGSDISLGFSPDLDRAKEIADKNQCRLKGK